MRQVRPATLAASFALSTAFQIFSALPLLAQGNFLPDSSTITLAVLDFKNNSGLFALDGLEKSLPEMLKTELSRPASPLLVVERQKLEAILQEQALGQTGVLDEKTAQTVGQLLGAQFLLTGEISTIGPQLRIDCHILKAATGQVRSEKVIGPDTKAIADMVGLLASNLKFNLTGAGEYRHSLRLKKYPASWFLLGTALAAAATGVTHWISREAYGDYQAATRLEEIENRYDRAANFRKARNGLAIASGVLALVSVNFWIKNHSDDNMVFAETNSPKREAALRFAFFAPPQEIGIGLRWHF
jgi:TolB-like protein